MSGGFFAFDVIKQFFSLAIELLGGLVVGHRQGNAVEVGKAQAGLERCGSVRESLESFVGRVHVFVAVATALAALGVDEGFGEEAGSMVVEVGRELIEQKRADDSGVTAGDMAVAQVLAHDRTVLAFDQGIVVGAPGARLGELDAQLFEQSGNAVIDVFGAVITVEAAQEKLRTGPWPQARPG